ncbi:MAG: type I restriction enzyme HsdR N-terminal domain-containing protein [Bacteroidia bacterium]
MHLNLPTYQIKITKQLNKPFIYDEIRKKYVSLTPEEWVRQHILNYLLNHKKFSKALIAVERKLTYLNSFKRFDILVFNNNAKADILIECKAPNVNLTSETALQLSLYNQQYKANIIIISNGLKHFAWKLNENMEYESFSFFE